MRNAWGWWLRSTFLPYSWSVQRVTWSSYWILKVKGLWQMCTSVRMLQSSLCLCCFLYVSELSQGNQGGRTSDSCEERQWPISSVCLVSEQSYLRITPLQLFNVCNLGENARNLLLLLHWAVDSFFFRRLRLAVIVFGNCWWITLLNVSYSGSSWLLPPLQ